MAMVADGYGIASAPFKTLVFSNIAWGYIIAWLPNLYDVQSYSWATYLALVVSYSTVLYSLIRNTINPIFASAILLLIYAPVFIYPQFTLVSGYLAFAAISLLCLPPDKQSILSISVSGAIFILSGLVRIQELLLVVIVTIPVFIGYWRSIMEVKLKWRWIVMASCVVVILALFNVVNQYEYSKPGWRDFNETNRLRAEFTDFNLGSYYKDYPETLKNTGYTENDLALFKNWFFIDPSVFAPERIVKLIHEVSWSERVLTNIKRFRSAEKPFGNLQIVFLSLTVLMLLVFHKRRVYLIAGVIITAIIMLVLLLLGRAGITRIYIPVFCALALFGSMQPRSDLHKILIVYPLFIIVTIAMAMILLINVHSRDKSDLGKSEEIRELTCQLPHNALTVIWGASYPYEKEYLPFRKLSANCSLDIYSLGALDLAPFALDRLDRSTGNKDLVSAILVGKKLDFIASENQLAMLQTYFSEHYNAELRITQIMKNKYFSFYNVIRSNVATGRIAR
jgi:hypothetical protein